jgi:hypothetical protein
MTTREQQGKAIVGDVRWFLSRLAKVWLVEPHQLEERFLRDGPRPLASHVIERLVASGRHEPGAGPSGNTISRPALESNGQSLLQGILGNVPIAEHPHERGHDLSGFVSKCVRHRPRFRRPIVH